MRNREMKTLLLLVPLLLAAPGAGGLAAQEAAVDEPRASAGDRVITGDHTIGEGEVVGDVVVVGGDLHVRGEVTGDAVIVGGTLYLEETGVIHGDAMVTGGQVVNRGGQFMGEMRTVEGSGGDIARDVRQAITEGLAAAEIGREAARAARDASTQATQRSRAQQRNWFTPIRRGMAGIISTLALGLVLAGIGALLVFYGRPYLETVSDTARGATIRSGATGLATGFLVFPAFVVLIVALAVSIIGIPLLLVAIPLYPLAVFAAATFGLLAVAHAIGERTAEQSRDGLDLRYRNSYAYLFTGLGMLLAPLVAAHLIAMTGFLGFIGTLLRLVTWTVIWVATTVGIGAVILSRAGTRRTFVPPPPPDMGMEADDLFDEPVGRGSHV
jgi:hypothetical protein